MNTQDALNNTALRSANNLSDLGSASTSRTNLGLGTLATQSGTFSGTSSGTNTGDQTISITGDVTASGSTGALTATVTKINGVALSGLATGILKNTTTTGVPSIAIAADFPTLNQNTTGSAATLTTSRNIQGVAFNGSANIDIINGTGFVKATGTTLSYDNSTYLTTSSAASTYQPLDSDLTTIAGLTATTDNFIVSVASAWASRTPAQVRTTLALVIGTNVQAWDADLDTIAALTATTDNFIQSKGSAWASRTPTQITADLIAMVGDSGSGGTKGLVPAPASGDATKFLKGNGTWAAIAGGGDALTSNPLSQFASTTSLQLLGVMSDETGTGSLVFATSPTLVTPILGTPTSGNFSTGTFTWPTFNQNTSGSSATLTTTRTIWGQNFNGSANVTGDITLSTANITMTGSLAATGARVTKGWFTDIESTNMPTVGGTAIISDTAYASSWNGVTSVAPSKNAVYDQMELNADSSFVKAIRLMGSAILYKTIGATDNFVSTLNMADGTAYYQAIYIDKSVTITGVKWWQTTAGSYTADNYNGVGLYSYSGGTLTLVASSTNDGNIWKATSLTFASKAFSSTYAASPGLYFVCALNNSSALVTSPTIGTGFPNVSAGQSSLDLTNSAKVSGTLASQASLPTPQVMSGITATAGGYWFALY